FFGYLNFIPHGNAVLVFPIAQLVLKEYAYHRLRLAIVNIDKKTRKCFAEKGNFPGSSGLPWGNCVLAYVRCQD
ncbi:hypothetical protein ACVGXS_04515, partial [Enterobacter hormaechei]